MGRAMGDGHSNEGKANQHDTQAHDPGRERERRTRATTREQKHDTRQERERHMRRDGPGEKHNGDRYEKLPFEPNLIDDAIEKWGV